MASTRARDLGPDLTHRKLVELLGPFERNRAQEQAREAVPFEERCRAAAAEVAILRGTGDRTEAGWREVHAAFERHGVEYKPYRSGARIGDLDSPQTVKPSEVDRALTLRAMTERFGPYETSVQARDRAAAREAVQRAENLVVGARLLEDPKPLMDRLTANNATYTLRAVDRLVAERVLDAEQRQAITQKIVDSSVPLVDDRGKHRFTTREVLAAEQNLATAAQALAGARRDVAITRPATGRDGVQLDEQQQRAYAYATEGDARLKVITGVPGAGKTRLIDAVAAAYSEAGYNVRAVSVANSAVDVVKRETSVPARSVTSELNEWNLDRGGLTNRDLLIIDEASTLGSAQGAALLREANERRAVVLAVGDDRQFQAVAHGSALELIQRAVGDRSVDMHKTRRQSEGWQREATEAVRRGEIRAAIDAYRERGFVHEHATQDEARAALIDRWRTIESTGVECGIEAFTNRERIAINELAREQWRDLGRLAGEDVRLETIDGSVPYAVGDRVIVRETIREAGLINGSVGTVRGIEDATLQIERRDGVVVAVDTREHPGVQHGYCSTEYREQGSTRYAELQLVTEQVNQRSLTVGMTRHTDEYGMFYSREVVGSYDDLVGLGLRTKSKELASDYRVVERVQARKAEPVREFKPAREVTRDVPTRWLSLEATRRELEPIAQGRASEYSRDERKAAFSVLNAIDLLEREAPHHQLRVPKDWHHSLRDPSALTVQISDARAYAVELARAQVAAEQAQKLERERAQERDLDRNRSRGMGRGR